MTANSPRPDCRPLGRLRASRRSLLLSCAIGSVLAWVGHGEQAKAQAFQATPTTVAGGVTYNRATPGIETISIDTPTAIINWTPTVPGNPIPFLPAGNVATFQNGNPPDFVVLNRILAVEPVRFDGTVISRLQGGSGPVPGGTILFSSPGGIIVGAGALFDVGSLVLTTLNVIDDGAGNFITPGGGFQFNGGDDFPNAAIITEAGSQIVASAENSYIALVAPVIVHGGSASVNGSAAYIAGEALEFTVNQGLFDIIVTTGSDNPTPITHAAGASTGGPASTGGTDNHAIYMVAVPKNQAIQMLLDGSVGFQPAVSASVENGVIILSSGFGVNGSTIQDIPPSPFDADIVITGGDFTSDVIGRASTEFRATALDDDLAFAGDLNMRGGTVASLGATGGLDTSVGGDLVIRAAASPEPDGIGGEAAVFADPDSSVTITGDALIDASGLGVIDELGAVGNGTGGTARVTADNGTIAFGGNLELRATGEGAAGVSTPDQGGFGQGGDIQLTADNGSVTIAGNLLADATGIGSASNGDLPGAGTAGTGGDLLVRAANNGGVTVTGASQILARGVGGDVEGGAGTGGAGQGGNVDVEVDNGDVDLGASSQFDVTGFGGLAPNGGTGAGGTVTVSALVGEVALGASASFEALGHGGSAAFAPGGDGGASTGGTIELRARGGTGGSLIIGGALSIVTQGDGGNGGDSDGLVAAGAGADGSGGNATLVAETGGGSLQIQDALVQSNGIGGSGGFGSGPFEPGAAGDGFGGNVTVGTEIGPAGPGLAAETSFAALDLEAFGFGGNGASGGTGTGGQIDLVAVAGTQVNVSGPSGMSADGFGGGGFGLGGAGGAGIGGGARIGAQGNVSLQDFAISANGIGGPGLLGAGGTGQGGLADVLADGADLDINGLLLVFAIGSGGEGGDPAAAGANATGGNIRIQSVNGGAISVAAPAFLAAAASGGTAAPGAGSQGGQGQGGAIDVIASGGTVALAASSALDVSGEGGSGPVGGNGRGGNVRVQAFAGSVDLGPVAAIVAIGIGADSNAALGGGGDGFGGSVELRALAGTAPSRISGGALTILAEGGGGRGGDRSGVSPSLPMGSGGDGAGGDVAILAEAANGALDFATGIDASVGGFGGDGGDGGAGAGGDGGDADGGTIVAGTELGETLGSAGSADLGSVQFAANAIGGAGGAGDTGGAGGNAAAGDITVQAENALVEFGAGAFGADGFGGAGGDGAGTDGAAGTGAGGDILFALDGSSGSDSLPPSGGSDRLLIDAGSITGSAGGFGASPTGNSAGRWRFDIQRGAMNAGNVALLALVEGSPAAVPASTIDLADGRLDIAGTGSFDAVGDILLSASGTGRLTGGDIVFRSGRFEAGHSGRAAADATVDVDTLLVEVLGDVVANAGSRIIAGELVALEAGGSAIIGGAIAAPEIRIRSADIDIASGGSVGDAGTQLTTLTVVPAADEEFAEQIVLGGTGDGPGYTLTDAEADRITSATLRVEAPVTGDAPDRPTDVLVGNLSLDAARVGRFELDTGGIVQVGGNLLLANAGADDGIEIAAGERIQIVTPSGSVRVRDAAGLPAGSLELVSRNIWSASQRLIDRLTDDPDFAGRDDELLVNEGPDEPRGYIEGGDVRMFAGDTLFVQNSGTPTFFAGITVLEDTLTIIPTGVDPLQVLAFGRRVNADGSYVTNDRFFEEVEFQQGPAGGGYTDASELNTCKINTGICRVRGPGTNIPGGGDIIEEPVGDPDVVIPLPGEDDELVDTSFADDPLIEEPVTSGADSILWDCDRDDDDDCDGDDGNE